MNQKELWKNIKGIKYYKVSNLGRVKSITRKINAGKQGLYYRKGRICKLEKTRLGYNRAEFYINNHRFRRLVDDLVANAFVKNPHPSKYNLVLHINGNKSDDRASNLQWCDNSIIEHYHGKNKIIAAHEPKVAVALFFNGGESKTFISIHDAAKFIKKYTNCESTINSLRSSISNVLSGRRSMTHGFYAKRL